MESVETKKNKKKGRLGEGGCDWLALTGGGWGDAGENGREGEGLFRLRHMCDSLLSLAKMKSRVWHGACGAAGRKERGKGEGV